MVALIQFPFALITRWWSDVSQTVAPTPQARHMMGFTFRTFVASMLALDIAFELQLDSPHWAWLTVWIVSQGTPGVTLSKSLYRVIGTIAGSFFGIVLIALFAQTPELFVLALATLVAGCTVLSNVLTNFRAYATVLTAYTAGIIASDAINTPGEVFFIAMARTSCILIGIAVSITVTSIFAPHRSAAEARNKLQAALKAAAVRAAYSWKGTNEDRLKMGRKLILDLIALGTLIEYASAESGSFRIQANHARCAIAHIFSLISARRALDAHLVRCGWPPHDALEIYHEVILDFLHDLPARLDQGDLDELISGLQEVRQQLDLLRPEKETVSSADLVSERFVIDRLDDLLTHLGGALEEWRDIVLQRWTSEPRLGLNFHRDIRAAWINGLRAFLAVIATGAFWIGSAWSSGPGALVFVTIMLSLFSSVPRPDKVGWVFFYASIPAAIAAMVFKYLFMSAGTGFEFLTAAMVPFLIPVGLLIAYPPTAFFGVAFSLVFLNLAAPANPQSYDLADSLNTALALILGVLFGTLAYVLIFPPDPVAARRYVTYRIRRGLEIISLVNPVPVSSSFWETRMYDRVMRLNDPQNPSADPTDEWLDAGLGALNLGNELLWLRRWLNDETMSAPVRAAAIKATDCFHRFVPEPQRTNLVVREEMERVARFDPGPDRPDRRAWARVTGSLEEMNVYLINHPQLTRLQPIR
jgi:uncharacterized membrane protein YccC